MVNDFIDEDNDNSPIDSTIFDFDLFSMDIYRDKRSINKRSIQFSNKCYPSSLFMIATAGAKFNTNLIDWNRNLNFINNIYTTDFEFEVEYPKNIDDIIKRRFSENNEETSDNFKNEKDSYLKTFKILASKGFFVYDKFNINDKIDTRFELICKPKFNLENYLRLFEIIKDVYSIEIKDFETEEIDKMKVVKFRRFKIFRDL